MNTHLNFEARWREMEAEFKFPRAAVFQKLPAGDFDFLTPLELRWLREVGLPDNTSDFYFDKIGEKMPRVDEVYGPNDEELWRRIGRHTVENFLVLGANGGGDPLVLDTTSHEIWLLDHESNFQPFELVNASIPQFFECMLVFLRAEVSLPDVDVELVQQKLRLIDPKMAEQNGYWFANAADLPDYS